MEGGNGLADLLRGEVDASGRLPFSVPRSESDLPAFDADAEAFVYDAWHGYWRMADRGIVPAYPFGFGLSYTDFELGDGWAGWFDGEIRVGASVHNTGGRPGSDVVQVYAHRQGSTRPFRLVGFGRVEVGVGERVELTLTIRQDALAVRDVATHTMVVDPGTYEFRIAHHATDPGLVATVEVGGEPGRA
jgi:beta-glucosidase